MGSDVFYATKEKRAQEAAKLCGLWTGKIAEIWILMYLREGWLSAKTRSPTSNWKLRRQSDCSDKLAVVHSMFSLPILPIPSTWQETVAVWNRTTPWVEYISGSRRLIRKWAMCAFRWRMNNSWWPFTRNALIRWTLTGTFYERPLSARYICHMWLV